LELKDFGRFVNPDLRAKDVVEMLSQELREKGIELSMCLKCGGLILKLTKPQREITEHECKE